MNPEPILTPYRSRTGVYYVNVHIPAPVSYRTRQSLHVRDANAVPAALEAFRRELLPAIVAHAISANSAPRVADTPPLTDLIRWYIDRQLPREPLAPKTVAKYTQVLEDFALYLRRSHINRWQQLNYEVIADYLDWLAKLVPDKRAKAPTATKTRDDIKAIIRRFLRTAHEQRGDVPEPPIKRWFLAPVRAHGASHNVALTPAELAQVLDAVDAHQPAIAHLTRFLAGTGCRISDALDLRWSQINLDTATVRRRIIKTSNLAQFGLSRTALDAIHAERARGIADIAGHVFTTPSGRPWTYNGAANRFRRALDAERIAILRDGRPIRAGFHTLRHTYSTHMADLGMPLPQLQAQRGDTRIETTMAYYHADPTAARPYLDRYDALISGAR